MEPVCKFPRPEDGEETALKAQESGALGRLIFRRLASGHELGRGAGNRKSTEVSIENPVRVRDRYWWCSTTTKCKVLDKKLI